MTVVFSVLLIVLSVVFSVLISPILMMVGVMGASDDPNAKNIHKFLGLGICLIGIATPILLFVAGTFLLLQCIFGM